MADPAYPRSYRIIQEIVRRLAQISIGNGYNSSLGANIQEGRENVSKESDTFPLASIIEGEERPTSRSGSQYKLEMPFLVDAYDEIPEGETILSWGHKLLADVKEALMPQQDQFNGDDVLVPAGANPLSNAGLVTEFSYDGRSILSAEADALVEVLVAFKVKWTENVSDPYA